jgi:hypothetical protein
MNQFFQNLTGGRVQQTQQIYQQQQQRGPTYFQEYFIKYLDYEFIQAFFVKEKILIKGIKFFFLLPHLINSII